MEIHNLEKIKNVKKRVFFQKRAFFFNLQLILTGSSGRETRNQLRPALQDLVTQKFYLQVLVTLGE